MYKITEYYCWGEPEINGWHQRKRRLYESEKTYKTNYNKKVKELEFFFGPHTKNKTNYKTKIVGYKLIDEKYQVIEEILFDGMEFGK